MFFGEFFVESEEGFLFIDFGEGGGVTVDERKGGMFDVEVENVEDEGRFGMDIGEGEKGG